MGGKSRSTNDQMVQLQMQQAAEARQKEAERQARLERGKTQIDALFANEPGKFAQAFDDKYRDAELNSGLDQLNSQYSKALERTNYALANAGLFRSTPGTRARADIASQRDTQEEAIRSRTENDLASLRSGI